MLSIFTDLKNMEQENIDLETNLFPSVEIMNDDNDTSNNLGKVFACKATD